MRSYLYFLAVGSSESVGNGLGGFFAAGEHFADVEEEFVYGVVGHNDCGGGYDQDAAEDFTAGDGLPENGHTERYGRHGFERTENGRGR